MPIPYLRGLTGLERSIRADIHLGLSLAFIAGAVNAGCFVAINQYTSHMTGIVSSIADGLVLGDITFALSGFGSLLCFIAGATCTEFMVNWARARQLQSEYALPLILEGILLMLFGIFGRRLHEHMGLFISITVMKLCFAMGIQNAIITRISNAVIRTTHITGIVTDIGIELGRLFFWNRGINMEDDAYVRANRAKLLLLSALLLMFFVGGIFGVLGFIWVGYATAGILAMFLFILAFMPLIDDVRTTWIRRFRRF